MIASLRGKIGGRTGNSVIVDVNGVGYLAQVSERTLATLGEVGSDIFLIVETQVREDAITLFGFADTDDRDIFRILTSVQGVGAKMGLSILSVLAPAEIVAAIVSEDKATIGRANGVGPRLAARIISELKHKVQASAFALNPAQGSTSSAPAGLIEAEVKDVLLGLGFSKGEIANYLATVRSSGPVTSTADAVQACLKLAGSSK